MSTQTTSNGHGDVDLTPVTQDHPTETGGVHKDLVALYEGVADLSHAVRDDLFRESLALYGLLKGLEGASPLMVAQAVNDWLAAMDDRVAARNRKEVRGRLNDWVDAIFDTPVDAHRYTINTWAKLAKGARANVLERRKSRKS